MNEMKLTEVFFKGFRKGGLPGGIVAVTTKTIESEARGQVRGIIKSDDFNPNHNHNHSHSDNPIVKVAGAIWASKYPLRGSVNRMSKKNVIMSHTSTVHQGQFGTVRKVADRGMPVPIVAK